MMKRALFTLLLLLIATPAWAVFDRTVIVSDGFDSAGNWTGLHPNNMTFTVGSSQFTSAHDVNPEQGNPARWSGTEFNSVDDQYSVAKIITIPASAETDPIIGVICRASADIDANRDYYFYNILQAAGGPTGSASRTTQIGSVKNGTTTIHATGSVTWAPNDTIEMECTGGATTHLAGFKNGVATGQTYDDSSSPLTTGRPGVLIQVNAFGDNFVGGSLAEGAPPAPSGFFHRRVQ